MALDHDASVLTLPLSPESDRDKEGKHMVVYFNEA